MHDLDVVGIGNALVDVITHDDDAFLDEHGLVKGSMTLIDSRPGASLYGVDADRHRDVAAARRPTR